MSLLTEDTSISYLVINLEKVCVMRGADSIHNGVLVNKQLQERTQGNHNCNFILFYCDSGSDQH